MSADNEFASYPENKTMSGSTVASILANAINNSSKTQFQIAREVGFDKQNMVSMIKQGYTKLPIYKVKLVADCLELDAKQLLDCCMREYRPKEWEVIRNILAN